MNINDETEETSRQSVPQEVEGRETGVFAAMETQRAVRRFRPESVPREVLESMVFYATRAPSGGNRQPWEFLVITDSKVIKSLAAIYEEASRPVFASSLAQATNEQAKRVYQDALYLTDHLDEAPAIILVCVSVPSGRTFEQQLRRLYGATVLSTVIPEISAYKVALSCRHPVSFYAPNSRAAQLMNRLGEEVLNRISEADIGRRIA